MALRRITARSGADEPPRLVLRFAVFTVIGLALGAAAILLLIRHFDTKQAERSATEHARFVATTLTRQFLVQRDFAGRVDAERQETLDATFTKLLSRRTAAIELYSPGSLVTYSTDRSHVGRRAGAAEIEAALHGDVVSHVQRARVAGREVEVLATYQPITFAGGRVNGVVAVLQDYAPIAEAATATFLPVAGTFEVVLLVLIAALVPGFRKVTRRIRSQMSEIERQAYYDELTGLPNRVLFDASIRHALHEAHAVRGEIAVMLMDLDGFKEINDTLGHQSGDTLLAEVGARLSRALGRDGIVARLGGDEFGVVVAVTSPSTVPTIVDRIRRALDRPYVLRGLPIRATASIGVSLYPEHGVDPGALLKHADVALYLAKESHGPYALYNPERDTNDARRLALVAELKQAIERGEIVLLFQPQADLRTGRILSVESLVRWRHPERGLLAPDEFVPLAERTGLIKPLSRFVLGEALRQCAAWHREGLDLRVAVNLTMPDLLDLELPRDIGTLLAQLALDPDKLELEMTESTVMADPARVRQVLEELHGMGVRLAIDDFGTGYSSLAYLKRLPARKLKIDKSFVLAMEHDASDATIVRSTIELGHNLGLEVVAEGVETPEVWRTLQQYGCDFAQGFLIGHPMYAEGVADLVRARGGTAPAGPDHGEPQPAPRHLAAVS